MGLAGADRDDDLGLSFGDSQEACGQKRQEGRRVVNLHPRLSRKEKFLVNTTPFCRSLRIPLHRLC
jgi:hypothetical protein